MTKELYLLFFINVCSAIGYSLIAPLYSTEAATRGIKENFCGVIISIFAISNFFATPFIPSLISKYGRKNLFYIACVMEAVCTMLYGLLYYVSGYYSFLFISVVARFFHGIGASCSATLGIGIAFGPICAAVFFYLGGYSLPFYVCGITILVCIPFIHNLDLMEENEGEAPQFMSAMFDFNVLTVFFTLVMDVFTKTFYFPTLTNHLVTSFGMSIEGSSIFFIIHIVSYFAVLNYINIISSRLGLKLTLVIGLFCNFIGALFLPPIPVLPQLRGTIVFGLLLLGIPSALINVVGICDLIDQLKGNKMNYDENTANDMASAIYNLGLNFGEALGPTFGGYVTEKFNFQTSCTYTSLLNISYCIFFFVINYQTIQTQLNEGKAETDQSDVHKGLTSDFDDYKSIRGKKIDNERTYVGRYRAYSYSNRSSKRSSLAGTEIASIR